MIKKLRKRFVIINMAIITGMLLIIFGLVIHFTGNDLDNKSDTMLQKLAQNALDPGAPEMDMQLPYFTLRFNTRGEVFARGKTHYDISDPKLIDALMKQIGRINKSSGYLEEYKLKYTVVTTPSMQVIAFLDISSHQSTLISLVQVSITTTVIALAIFTLISILLAWWTVNPIDKAWKQQKQFVSDASHELKTPLTVIMSNAELLQNPDYDAENQQRFKNNILAGSRQMRQLVEGMLELARADNGQIQTHFDTVNMSKTVLDSLLPFEPVFYENGKTLHYAVAPDIQLHGSSQHLHQLTDILLDNAQKYSTPGIIELRLCRQGKHQCLLSVSNPGNPIAEEELEAIFRRFYRSDTARSNNSSFGLGLSIAQRIAEEHGGKIWAESNQTGNCFYVLLPCSPE